MNETEDFRPAKPGGTDDEDPRLVEAVRAYQAALDDGRRPSRRDFLARYPDIAAELSACLDGLEFLHSAAPRLQTQDGAGQPADAPPVEGTLGDYRLVREVGRGGMGVVYEAVQLSLGRRVALKVLPFAATMDPRQLQRFENEARAAAHLHHPHIVPVFAVGCERGVHYYAMQFIDGQTVAAVIDYLRQATQPALPGAETVAVAASLTHQSVASKAFFRGVATVGLQAAGALEYAHQMGVVHRDVKPANLLLDGRGNLWVTDFGLARFQAAPGLTSPGDLVGTLRYMSPEQAAGQPVIDPRSDVYGLGVTLYELITQQPAFPGADRQQCLRQILEEEPTNPRRWNPRIPAELETIVLKAMAKRPEDRYATAGELAEDLTRFLDDRPVQARRPGLQEQLQRWVWRHRRVVAAAVLGLVAAVFILGVTTWRIARAEAQTNAALEQEVKQRDRAESNYRQALKVLDYLTRLGVKEFPDDPRYQELRRRLLTALVSYYEEFIDQHGDDETQLRNARFRVAELLAEVGKKADAYAAYMQAIGAGERSPTGPRPPPPFGGPHGPPRGLGRLFLLRQPTVHQDLKLSAAQVREVMQITDLGPKRPAEERLAGAEKDLDAVLKPEQTERLRQIIRQIRMPHTLLEREAVKALDLTPEQEDKIHAVMPRGGRGPRGPGGPGPGRGERPPEVSWKQVIERALAVLTPQQRERWQKMVGAPFQGEIRFGPPRGR